MSFLTPIEDPALLRELTVRVTALAAMYPAVQLQEETITGYCQALQDVPLTQLDVAMAQAQQECKFFPSIAEIRERVLDATLPQHPEPAAAWEAVVGEFSRVGHCGEPRFADPLVARTVRAMDWVVLCGSENAAADRAHFLQLYAGLVKRERDEARLLPEFRAVRARLNTARECVRGELPAPPSQEVCQLCEAQRRYGGIPPCPFHGDKAA